MPKTHIIRRGKDIPLQGSPQKELLEVIQGNKFAVCPPDFRILNPRLLVKEGDSVLVGSALFENKLDERIVVCSPASGIVKEIVRGEKRFLEAIIIESDQEFKSIDVSYKPLQDQNAGSIKETLLKTGLWPTIIQRPYGIIAKPDDEPKAIFISGFDSSPLKADVEYQLQERTADFQAGIDVLTKITKGKIHLSLHRRQNTEGFAMQINNVELHWFDGPHPAGNISVQISRIDPINKGDIVWTINALDVANIGLLFSKGKLSFKKRIAFAGAQLSKAGYADIVMGCQVATILEKLKTEENVRIISGDVLTGTNISKDGYLRFYDTKVSLLKEGDYYEFFGWAKPGFGKFSLSKTFFSWLTPNKKYVLDTNFHGGERAFVVTGEYEKVFPMDIYPVALLKAILAKDIDLMEKLGIYEIVEEDFALCEFACTSKIESQQIVREGLDLMIKEMN